MGAKSWRGRSWLPRGNSKRRKSDGMRSNPFPRVASLVPVALALVAALIVAGRSGATPRSRPSLPPFCIAVRIGSEGPFLFGFDTGISPSTVTPELVQRLKLPVTGTVQISDASSRGHHTAKAVRVPALTTLGRVFGSHRAVVVPASKERCSGPSSGTLGLSLFRDHLLIVDLQSARLELAEPTQARQAHLTEADPHTLPYRLERSLPMIKIAVGPALLRAGIDTGGEFTIILPTVEADRLPLGPVLANGRMRTVAGEFSFKQAQLFGTLVLGGNDVPAPVISYSDHFPIAILGRRLLARFLLTFDQKNHLVRIAPRTAAP